MAADLASENGAPDSPGLLRVLRRISVVLLLVVQFAIAMHFAGHLADGHGNAAECAVCVAATSGATPTPELVIAAPSLLYVGSLFAPAVFSSAPQPPAHFQPRGPPHAHVV